MWTGLEQCLLGDRCELLMTRWDLWKVYMFLIRCSTVSFSRWVLLHRLRRTVETGRYVWELYLFWLRRDQSYNIKCTGSRDMHKDFWNMNNLIISAMHWWLVSSVGSYHVSSFTLVCHMPRYCHPNDDNVKFWTYLTREITLHVIQIVDME
jgi:hypothetical protein